MTRSRFEDRLDPSTYRDDDEVVGIFETDASEPDALWLSGRLLRRLTTIAQAYELHTLPLLVGVEEVRLNETQLPTLLEDIAFVAERGDDPALVGLAQQVTDYVAVRVRRAGWTGQVTFDLGG